MTKRMTSAEEAARAASRARNGTKVAATAAPPTAQDVAGVIARYQAANPDTTPQPAKLTGEDLEAAKGAAQVKAVTEKLATIVHANCELEKYHTQKRSAISR